MKPVSSIALMILLLFIAVNLSAQQYHTDSKKAVKYFKEAYTFFNKSSYEEALKQLDKAIKADHGFVEAYMMKAQIYKDLGENNAAVSNFKTALSLDPDFYPEGYMVLASTQFNDGNYEEAKKEIRTFLDKGIFRQISKEEGEDFLKRVNYAIYAVSHPVEFEPVNLGDSINSDLNEYRPTLSLDNQMIIFTVMVPKDPSKEINMNNVQEDFYIAERNEDGSWGKRKTAGAPLNTERNEGAQSLSSDGRILYFTACDRMEGFGRCDIYYSIFTANRWSQAINLGSGVNTSHSDKHPSISSDGNKLYFASDRPGGYGGLDIWCSEKSKNGSWGKAYNLGEIINTSGNEQSPFIHPDNQNLYFASEGHENLGKGDVFISKLDSAGNWEKPQNLGYPINTNNDEIGIVVDPQGKKAYFSSNRIAERRMDIFSFDLPESVRATPVSYFKGKVYDSKTLEGISADFELIDLSSGKTVMRARSDFGDGNFLLPLPTDKNYALNVSHPGYLFYSDHFEFKGIHAKTDPFIKNVPLIPIQKGESIVLKNIFFEFDSYHLLDESKVELQKIVEFLDNNPNVNVEISGHTDNIGNDQYNMNLSENRAESVYNYLILKGIAAERLIYKGYGASRPVAENDTEEGRSLNRRTEMKIL